MVQEEQSRQMIWLIPFYVWRAVQGLSSTYVVCHEELELHTYIHKHALQYQNDITICAP